MYRDLIVCHILLWLVLSSITAGPWRFGHYSFQRHEEPTRSSPQHRNHFAHRRYKPRLSFIVEIHFVARTSRFY
ncbi:hypothetical protein V1505DRAFT_374773 [Lipomyces doorenjongii]